MRKLFGKRWALIGFLAPGIIALTAPSAAAVTYNVPAIPYGSVIVGPGCSYYGGSWTSGFWATEFGDWGYAGGDYAQDGGTSTTTCNGISRFTQVTATDTAQFSWWLYLNDAVRWNCHIYAYIPWTNATDFDTRYDFYGVSNSTSQTWLGWPGATVDQYDYGGWTDLGGVIVPAGTTWLKVVLNNADPYAPGYWVGAGDMAFDCHAV